MKPEKFLRGLDPARDAEEDARRAEEHKENRETEKARMAEILEMALRDPAHYEIRKEHDGMISGFQKTENGEE
ncbi:MAG: hypothetical protein HY436_01400 [Candidatus Liptonbacteria bacterium]|nr:hypothetical protein [Candidatus Liptonbacteria bacterium]